QAELQRNSTHVTSMVTASIGKAISAATLRRRLHMNGLYAQDTAPACTSFKQGYVTAVRYQDEVLEPVVRLYAAAVGPNFVLMDDNARPHRADIGDDYLESEGIARMA
ncbi:transposable element Tcb1 transposase, partial [Trichonephila clavipes]